MKFHSFDYEYNCVPPVLDNENQPKDEQVIIVLKGMSQLDKEKIAIEQEELQATYRDDSRKLRDMIIESNMELYRRKIVRVENLEIDGKQITTFDDLRKYAPAEFAGWAMTAIYSTRILSEAERKN